MTDQQQRSTIYVATSGEDDWRVSVSRADYERPEAERSSWQRPDAFQARSGINAVWQVDLAPGTDVRGASAIAAVLNAAAGVYTSATVTQLYPRPRTAEEQLDDARSILRRDYWNDVRGVVDGVKKAIEDREITTQDEVTEWLDQAVDGHQRVIYTDQAIECLLFSSNDEAYEEYGDLDSLGADSACGLYSKLAYCAFRADVADELGDIEALLEDAKTFCADCDKDISDEDDNVTVSAEPLYAGAAPLEVVLCSDCAAERREGEDK